MADISATATLPANTYGKDAEARHHRGVEVGSSDPDGDADADEEAENRADRAHGWQLRPRRIR